MIYLSYHVNVYKMIYFIYHVNMYKILYFSYHVVYKIIYFSYHVNVYATDAYTLASSLRLALGSGFSLVQGLG